MTVKNIKAQSGKNGKNRGCLQRLFVNLNFYIDLIYDEICFICTIWLEHTNEELTILYRLIILYWQ